MQSSGCAQDHVRVHPPALKDRLVCVQGDHQLCAVKGLSCAMQCKR